MNYTNYNFHRGEVYLADVSPAFTLGTVNLRPVLVLLNDSGSTNCPVITVTVGIRPFGDVCPEPEMFCFERAKNIDKRRVRRCIGTLSDEQMERVDSELRQLFYLSDEDFLPLEIEIP